MNERSVADQGVIKNIVAVLNKAIKLRALRGDDATRNREPTKRLARELQTMMADYDLPPHADGVDFAVEALQEALIKARNVSAWRRALGEGMGC